MTKISFDVDFNQDPDKILQEIQKRAEAEVAKREAKDKEKHYLSKLHEVVNKEIGSDFKNINALIRALTKYASPSVRNKIDSTTPSGRRKTISMNKEIYDQIQTLLARPNPNKAAIARETGVSVVQVRKVAEGGYDEKYGKILSSAKPSFKSLKLQVMTCHQSKILSQLWMNLLSPPFLQLKKIPSWMIFQPSCPLLLKFQIQ